MSARKAHTVPMISGDEYDAFTGFRRLLNWRAGDRKPIKRRYNKRMRKAMRPSGTTGADA